MNVNEIGVLLGLALLIGIVFEVYRYIKGHPQLLTSLEARVTSLEGKTSTTQGAVAAQPVTPTAPVSIAIQGTHEQVVNTLQQLTPRPTITELLMQSGAANTAAGQASQAAALATQAAAATSSTDGMVLDNFGKASDRISGSGTVTVTWDSASKGPCNIVVMGQTGKDPGTVVLTPSNGAAVAAPVLGNMFSNPIPITGPCTVAAVSNTGGDFFLQLRQP